MIQRPYFGVKERPKYTLIIHVTYSNLHTRSWNSLFVTHKYTLFFLACHSVQYISVTAVFDQLKLKIESLVKEVHFYSREA